MIHWLSVTAVRSIHFEVVREHGGNPGLRDEYLLLSAVGRPKNLAVYSHADIFRLAAAYAYGICGNHPFIDGNKRTSLMTAYVFLRMNGYKLVASEEEAAATFLDLAAGTLSEARLANWLRRNAKAAREI
ncbi:MAG: type II toxin-antitoxin system death-on-curing family toxin [Candidatus Hydrogenedentes bacterium]|nr:type II toxin-antitoxin system death-on-curing family toxin [Candidatus Hydrogenedentota bacterium]